MDLVGGDHDALKLLSTRPSIKARASSEQIASMAADVQRANPGLDLSRYYLDNELSDEDLKLFELLGISVPLAI